MTMLFNIDKRCPSQQIEQKNAANASTRESLVSKRVNIWGEVNKIIFDSYVYCKIKVKMQKKIFEKR